MLEHLCLIIQTLTKTFHCFQPDTTIHEKYLFTVLVPSEKPVFWTVFKKKVKQIITGYKLIAVQNSLLPILPSLKNGTWYLMEIGPLI